MIIFHDYRQLGVKTKMAAVSHIEFLTLDRKALESCVKPHF